MMASLVNFMRKLCMLLLALSMIGTVASAGRCFEMSPRNDIFLVAGGKLQLNCSLKLPNNDTGCVNDEFILNKTRILKGNEVLAADLFTYYTAENTIEMMIDNVSVEDSGTYNCRYGDSQMNESFKPVHIGEAPGEPKNLVCISRNYEDLACSFSLSKLSNIPIKWSMEFKMHWGSDVVNCSNGLDLSLITCGKMNKNIFGQLFRYEISVKGENIDYGVKVIETFKIQANKSIVKPDPVVNLNVTINSTNNVVTVSWQGPDGLTTGDKVVFAMDYEIKIKSEWDNFTKMITNATERSKEYSLIDLIPYTNYTVTVLVKPSAATGDIYWSESNTLPFLTPTTVSERSVSMTTGSFLLQACGDEAMCPVIYWKNPLRKFWNGPFIGYKINVEEIDNEASLSSMHGHIKKRNIYINQPEYRLKRLIVPMTKNVTGLSVSSSLMPLSMLENYKIDVTLINSEGMSKDTSELFIPHWSKGQRLKPEWVSVEVGDKVVDVSWGTSSQICRNITSATVYWCLIDDEKSFNGTHPMVHCKDIFDWSTFSITEGCENRTSRILQKSHDTADLRFAVSLETNKLSGGLVWEKFRFKTRAVPERPLYKVDSEGNQLVIVILYGQYYNSEGGQPDHYLISYSECTEEAKCLSDKKTETFVANFTTPVHKIENLKSGSRYRVSVTASNRFGKSKEGEPVEKKIENDESSDTSLVLALGCVGGALVIGLVISLVLCCRKRHKQMKADLEVTVPEPNGEGNIEFYKMMEDGDNAKLNNYQSRDNHDSGKGSDSPGSSLDQHSVQQQDDVTELEDFPCQESDSPVLGKNNDKQHLVHAQPKSSPVLSGYHKHVSDVPSTDQGTIESSEDEIDEDLQDTHSVKKMLKGNEKKKMLKQDEVPCSDEDKLALVAEEKKENVKEESRKGLRMDYSLATILNGKTEKVLKHSNITAGENENIENDVGEFSKSRQDVEENYDKGEDIKVTPLNGGGATNEVVGETKNVLDTERISDCSDSNAVDFEDFIDDLNKSSNPYKNPDEVSLGDGSTVSDFSCSSIIDTGGTRNPDEDFDMTDDDGESAKDANDASIVEEDLSHISSNADEKAETNKKIDDDVNQDDKLLDRVTEKGIELYTSQNSGKACQEENVVEDGKNTSGPASLEPYIKASLGSNGFLKSSKLNKDDINVALKGEVCSKPLKGQTDIPVQSSFQTNTEA